MRSRVFFQGRSSTEQRYLLLVYGSGLTGAVVLVAVVRTVLASVTSPAGWDAQTVVTLELRGWTLGHQSFYTETATCFKSIKLYLY